LCPTMCFDSSPIYIEGDEPSAREVAERRRRYWQPYHDRLREELDALRARHGLALLYEAHTIRSEVPRFFAGKLPDLNLGTAGGESCEWSLEASLAGRLKQASGFTHAVNGRFTGGYITRHYGRPAEGVHAVQLEQAQCTYMNESHPFDFREDLAAGVRPVLRALLETMLEWAARRSA
ncbi:MAG: N-formylglutamate amidohydrolase, partial [Gammaproteobacteria bacterium]|nr:N-formylglutamate amidohydrolase [Gammaproteobacteria bacterium]